MSTPATVLPVSINDLSFAFLLRSALSFLAVETHSAARRDVIDAQSWSARLRHEA